jgi:hypothetical protein
MYTLRSPETNRDTYEKKNPYSRLFRVDSIRMGGQELITH